MQSRWKLGRGAGVSVTLCLLALTPIPALAQSFTIYTVQSGDTLYRISDATGCPIDDIRDLNNIDGDLILAGQDLQIPSCGGGAPQVEMAEEPDTAPLETEPDFSYVEARGFVSRGIVYEVDPGDVLEDIAERYECSVPELAAANGVEMDVIFAGDLLVIPECNSASGRNSGYRVRSGDTLGEIADREDCTVEEIVEANDIVDGLIRRGQRLVIPDTCSGDGFAADLGRQVDETTLVERMTELELDVPRSFIAYVIEIEWDETRSEILDERRYDWNGTSDDATGWNSASTVKLYTAIAALQAIREMGYTPQAQVTFGDSYTYSLEELVLAAVGPSDNIAYDWLATFVGFDALNGDFFSADNGFEETELRRAYYQRQWMNMGMSPSFRYQPTMFIEQDGYATVVDENVSELEVQCRRSACTTASDLGETMRRVMLQEHLPDSESFGLHTDDLALLRETLSTVRTRGEEAVNQLRPFFSAETRFYHKAGYSLEWYTDNIYIDDPTLDTTWVVTMSGHEGRDSLDDAAFVLGSILSTGGLN